MKLHEYQGKELLQNEGVEIPESRVAYFPEEAWMVSMNIGYPVMLKAQVLTGGRGKSGGVKKCRSAEEVRQYSRQMFGSVLTTHQSGKNGLKVRKILVEKAVDYEKEFYLSFVL
jgi:succinyl-CoA synthetase beta subunit